MTQVMRSHYENLDVRIEKVGESYRTRVSADSSGEGEATADPSAALAQLDGFLFKVGQARRRTRGQADVRLSEAKKFGATLFESVFRGDALVCLERSLANASARRVGTRIRLRLAGVPELSDIPWEFLYSEIGKEFLSLSAYTPVIRYLDFPESIRPLEIVSPLRILVVISSPTNYPQLDVEREWKTLRDILADLLKRKLVVLERLDKPQLAALPRALRNGEFHILHFIGHGEFDDHGGALVFEDDWQRGKAVSADKLGTVLHDQLSLRLVVLNACEGARASRSDPFSGTAQTLVRQGIPAVLAMQFEITDEAAIAITSEFYSSVAVGDPIDAALADARLKLYALQDDGVEWATPVLHMRSTDGRIFDVAQTGPVIDKQKERVSGISILAARSRQQAMLAIFAIIGLVGAVVLPLWALDMLHWPNKAGGERSASQPAPIPDATTAAPIFDKTMDGNGPDFAPPTLSGRRIDLCIISPQFPEETGAQCSRPAQIQIANAFCRAAGFRSATNDIYGRNTGQNNKSYKYSEGPGGGQWLKQAGGGAMFESIVCD